MWDKALAQEDAAGGLWARSSEMARLIKGDRPARLLTIRFRQLLAGHRQLLDGLLLMQDAAQLLPGAMLRAPMRSCCGCADTGFALTCASGDFARLNEVCN